MNYANFKTLNVQLTDYKEYSKFDTIVGIFFFFCFLLKSWKLKSIYTIPTKFFFKTSYGVDLG